MTRATFVRRHRAGIASGAALAVAASALVAYAVTADGYKKHEAELNDGGVWVVNGKKGWSGRLNKPINQLDGVVPTQDGKTRLDVVQDGAAVVTLNLDASRGQSIETTKLESQDGGSAAVPTVGDVGMGGGTLASVDAETGEVWAVRYDDQVGRPVMSAVDRQAEPIAEAGEEAALAVGQDGTVVVTSAEQGTITTLAPRGAALARPETRDLPRDAGQVDAVTTVGDRVVTLDTDAGVLRVLGGATASVPSGSALQQAGPDADAVLVGAPDGLLSVDLQSGEATPLSTRSGTPVAPVRLGACVFGAWSGGQGAVTVRCGSQVLTDEQLGGDATSLAFRVNRGEIVLNDALSGTVWDVQQEHPVKIDNWEAFTSKKKDDEEEDKDENQSQADKRPPQAKPDRYGVRAGRTTVLHPLDNDSAPDGRLLSIVDVDQPAGGARVEISPDGQTLVLEMPEKGRPASFDYFIDDGRDGLSAHASVTVDVRAPNDNQPPELRQGYKKPTYKVPHGGALEVPVLADWRDDADGDTLLLASAQAVGGEETGAVARSTADGRIRFTAPTARVDGQQLVRVDFAVTDGRSAPVKRSMNFQVQAPQDQKSFPPTAEPDVVRGEVGKPIKIRPLLNDLPGSDPATPNAELVLAGKVPQQPGSKVVSDLDAGTLTFTGDRPGTYFLSYDAGYGNADLDQGTIRVDVKPRPKRAADPVAMPDTLTVYGQAPGVVDVLANDLDPAGGLLVVTRATAGRAGQLDVAIIDGRWLRISARQPELTPSTQTVSYTISNGSSSGVSGEVVVTQRPAPTDNTPITVADKVVVRAGASVSAPVLDNDSSPAGDRLTLVTDVVDTDVPGELEVVAPVDVTGDVGKAFVSGRVVRYVAPERIAERDTFTVPYVAQNLEGKRATGRLQVTIVPADDPNDPPEPPTLEGRVVSGDTVKVRVPGVGVDRNGDPVTVTGITSAPRLGRIVSFGGNFLEYQAYPRTVGTDEFSYSVVDSQGAFATGTVRVAVVPPAQPQPPLAVEDRLTVQPGRTATFDPLANDFVAPGDTVDVELLSAPDGARLDPETNLVTVPAPDDLEAEPVVLVYRVTNGIDESRATMTLETDADYNNPPVVYDAFGRAGDSGSVVVDVLEGAYDPDGPVEDLEVVAVSGGARIIDGVEVRANRGAAPQVLPFQVRDADGATAAASVYVPPTGTGLPSVRPDALIKVDPGDTTTGRITDYIEAPDGAEVRLASGRRSYSASPTALTAGPDGDNRFSLSAPASFRGPGALLVEVTTATDASGNEDASTTSDGATVLLSIPVYVGDNKPSLECPTTVVPISAGQRFDLDIATFCKVYTDDPRDAAGLSFEAGWSTGLDGLDVGRPEGSVVAVSAADTATEGGEAVLAVRAGDSNTEEVRFRLAQAPSPTLLPIKVETMEAGQTRTFDVGAYLEAGVADPDPTIVSVDNLGNPGVRASYEGGRLTLTAAKDARGVQASFRIVVSDVSSSDPPASRRAQGRIQFKVVGTPSPPGEPRPYPNSDQVGTVTMSWAPPDDDGGAPILYYWVREERSGDKQRCATNECVYRRLKTGGKYSFRAAAVNRVGQSEWSDLSRSAQADTAPGRVQNIRMRDRGDGTITVAWDKPSTQTSKILDYTVSWPGGGDGVVVPGDQTSYTATGLDNNQVYVFTVRAHNKVDYSLPRSSPEMQPLGTPPAPAAPTVTDLETGANQTNVRIAWQAVLPEGPGPTVYSVTYNNGQSSGTVPGCQKLASLSCTHSGLPYNGATYTYRVVASNQPVGEPPNRSAPSAPTSVGLVGRPAAWADWSVTPTGANQEVQVSFTVPDARGSTSNVDILVNGAVTRSLPNTTGAVNTRISLPSNELAYAVELRVCNENAPAGCTVSGAKQTQSYGPLGGALHEVRPVVNGKSVYWVVTGTANGAPVSVQYRVDNGQTITVNPGVSGQFSFQTQTFTTERYRQNIGIQVVVSDPARPGRGQDQASNQTQSGNPPPPVVRIERGPSCGDGPNTERTCRTAQWETPCLVNSCSFVTLYTDGFVENYRCTVSGAVLNGSSGNPGWLTQNYPGGYVTAWYAPGNSVTVTCTDSTGYQSNSSTTSWEIRND